MVTVGVAAAVATGEIRQSLEAIRDRLAAELDEGAVCKNCGGSVSSPTAALAKQLAAVVAQIEALPTRKASAVDDLASRRSERRAGAAEVGIPAAEH